MKKKYLLTLLSASVLAAAALVSCGQEPATSSEISESSTSEITSSEEEETSEETSSNPEASMTREEFLNKLDTLASENEAARAAMTTYKASMSTTVNGEKLPVDHTGEFAITDGKITVLGKEFTILTTKASFEADYLADVASYESEAYGRTADDAYQFNISMTKNDGQKYQFVGSVTAQGTFHAGRYFGVDSEGKKTTIWWLAPSAAE